MNAHLSQLISAFIARTARERLLALSEGLIKVRCIESGLSLGWTAQEGAGRSPLGDVADYVSEIDGVLAWQRGPRRHKLSAGSCDVVFVSPVSLGLEVKSRPDYGTKSQSQFQEMQYDVQRVSLTPNLAFLFVFDPKAYYAFSGEKTETRGRRAKASDWFVQYFPSSNQIAARQFLEVEAPCGDHWLSLAFWARSGSSSYSGVVAVGTRSDSNFT